MYKHQINIFHFIIILQYKFKNIESRRYLTPSRSDDDFNS